MSKPWFFELLEVGTYYGTTEYVQHFKCAGCGTICSNDGMMSGEPEPYCVVGYKCECGHEVTKEEMETWKGHLTIRTVQKHTDASTDGDL